MGHIFEIILFIILFGLIVYLFLALAGFYRIIEEEISNSELKMSDKINEVKSELIDLKKTMR